MISVREIHKSYGNVRAVRGVGFEVPRGVVAGLLGPNGAGKSTTIRILTGFIPPDSGGVRIAGVDAGARSLAARRRMGYLPESAPMPPEMRAKDYLGYRATLYGVMLWARGRAVRDAIERCGLGEVARRRIGHLSKGYRQRLGLAAAIVHSPPVVILDEPTNGLDPVQIREVRALIRELGRDQTVLMSSHVLGEIEQTCDRIIVMARGRIRADATKEDLLAGRGLGGSKGGVSGGSRVEAEFHPGAGGPAGVLASLRDIEGVRAVSQAWRTEDGWVGVRLETVPGLRGDPRAEVASRIVRAGGALRELSRTHRTLEQVFIEAIEQPDEDESVPSGDRASSRRRMGSSLDRMKGGRR